MNNSTLEILNIGPLKKVQLELKKVNVFIGKQSSGKSTLAKIISYCNWVEKDVSIRQTLEEYKNDGSYFLDKLKSFHKLEGYFNKQSEIRYESDIIKIHYKSNNFSIKWKDKYDYKRSKISYIPSERNLVTFPEMESLNLSNDYLKSFLFDWFDARKSLKKEKSLKLLSTGIEFYYSENNRENHIFNGKEKYDILLSNASSGIQSVAPLIVMIDYLTNHFYEQEEKSSYEKREIEKRALNNVFSELFFEHFYDERFVDSKNKLKNLIDLKEKITSKNPTLITQFDRFSKIATNINETQSTTLIIEEPEQNLFPSTQKDLIYFLLNRINSGREHHLALTTHSPYILYAINNCIMADLVKDRISEEEKGKLGCFNSKIASKLVAIYELDNGSVKSIQDDDGLIEDNYFNKQMEEVMDEFYLMLNHY